jgi:membrane protein
LGPEAHPGAAPPWEKIYTVRALFIPAQLILKSIGQPDHVKYHGTEFVCTGEIIGMKVRIKGIGSILKKTFREWNASDPFRQSAVIAYYAIFSLPALLVLIINVAGFFFEKEAINGEISRQIGGIMGEETAETVEGIVKKAGEVKAGVISTVIAVVTIIFGATGVFVQLQKTLNEIWNVKLKPDVGFMVELRHRLFSFGLIISIGFLMLISLVISSLLAALSHYFEAIFPEAIAYLFYALEFVVSLAVISTLFLLMFKFLPDVKNRWKDLILGSVITGLLFMFGKYGLSIYFGKAEPASVYGAAGTIVLVLLWVSYSSMIVFFGAEFTQQYALYHGIKAAPTEVAEKFDSSERSGVMGGVQAEKEKSAEKKSPYRREQVKHASIMKKVSSKKELEDEITRLEARLAVKKIAIKQQLQPAKVVKDILQKRTTIPRPANRELAMEGFDFAINLLTDRVLFKNANPTVRTLAVYVMREIAKNYVYGRSEKWVDHARELLNIRERGPASTEARRLMDDPVDDYYENM